MVVLIGRDEGIKYILNYDVAFIAPLTDSKKGMSTRSLPPTDYYTLEFEKYDQIRGPTLQLEEPFFHYMQTGSGGQVTDPKTHKLVPAPEPKRPKINQLYLVLLNEPRLISHLVEITEDDIDSIRQAAGGKKSH